MKEKESKVCLCIQSWLKQTVELVTVCCHTAQAKHIQYVSGVRTSTYWLSTFAWDMLNALGPIVISIVLFAAFQIQAYSTVDALAAIFLLLASHSKSSIVDSLMISLSLSPSLAPPAAGLLGKHPFHLHQLLCVF